ncbi:MAG: RNase adapter RapZ [Pseudomonadota bacterium]
MSGGGARDEAARPANRRAACEADTQATIQATIQATCVAIRGAGVLILGAPGVGKSRLALQLMALGGGLVADDVVRLSSDGGGVWAEAAPAGAGLIEARGVGVLRTEAVGPVRLAWVLELGGPPSERLPSAESVLLCGVELPLFRMGEGLDPVPAIAALANGAVRIDPEIGMGAEGLRPETGGGRSVSSDPQSDPAEIAAGAPPAAAETCGRTAEVAVLTGRCGAGRSTAINALEDLGFETVDRPPLSFAPAIAGRVAGAGRRVALGFDAKTDGFSPQAFRDLLDALRRPSEGSERRLLSVFLDCEDDALRRRYVETRRRHPMAPMGSIDEGLAADRQATDPLREAADMVIDTSRMTPGELRRAIEARFADAGSPGLSLTVLSFSYKHGLPPEADLVVDCRFLRNPHYDADLRPRDGRDAEVARYVASDPLYGPFLEQQLQQADLLLPAFQREGKSYVTVAFGCTGGRHRSVAVAEEYARSLAGRGWRPLVRHREQDGDAARSVRIEAGAQP